MSAENRLLVIGIDGSPAPRFNAIVNAKTDCVRIVKVLTERYGFILAQEPLYDEKATQDNILDALIELASTTSEQDNLIVYFAGHGEQHPTSKKGYWIPYDAGESIKKYILNSTVLDHLDSVQAQHILLISDSCFSGTFLTRTRGPGKRLTYDELDKLRSRWLFVSGGETPVSDGEKGKGSPFGIALCNFLEKNTATAVSAEEVFDAVIRLVESKSYQVPEAADKRRI